MYRGSTPQAQLLKEELEKRGVIVEAEKWDGHKHIDLVIARAQLNIEVDGKQHYENWQQILRDLERNHHSDRKGWDTIHVPNAVIESAGDLRRTADAIAFAARVRAHALGNRLHYRHYECGGPDRVCCGANRLRAKRSAHLSCH